MDYNRMIAYIYSYNDGLKSKNTGFAKIEVRQNVLKLQINMKGAYADNVMPWNVNLFYRENGKIRGISLGEIKIRNGMGEYRYTGNAADIADSGKAFASISGLYISGGGMHRMYASEWDDLGFSPDAVAEDGPGLARSGPVVEYAVAEPEIAEPETAEPAAAETAKQPDKPSLFAGVFAEAVNEAGRPVDDAACTVVLEAAEVDGGPETDAGAGEPGAARQQAQSGGNGIIDSIIDGREKVFLFADDDLYDVVEISLDDLAEFPEEYIALANNSFVNHGYYNFRHLILGRIRDGKGSGYFIGVPGVYTRRDRSTASMFGFNYFKFSMRSDVRMGQFGYWYREL